LPNRLVADGDTTLGQQQLDVPQAQRERLIEPYRMADDFGRKSVAMVRIGIASHRAVLPQPAALATAGRQLDNALRQ
jgi:hypothetical protein